jgi:hypothetical protein
MVDILFKMLNQLNMKKSLLLLLFSGYLFLQNIYAQDSPAKTQLSQLVDKYYGIKDALVADNSSNAATAAGDFIKTANSIDYKEVSEGNINILLKDATQISTLKDISQQRLHFAALSNNMIALVKAAKTGTAPIYRAYCPMKKASWLTNEKEIKNPYYGSDMLTCGEIKETIGHN